MTTRQQLDLLIKLTKNHEYLAEEDVKKGETKDLWNDIALELNSIGPAVRSGESWKKVWIDFRRFNKHQQKYNKKLVKGTDDDPNMPCSSLALEDVNCRMKIFSAVDGIADKPAFTAEQSSVPKKPVFFHALTQTTESYFNDSVTENIKISIPPIKRDNVAELCKTQPLNSELLTNLLNALESLKEVEKIANNNLKRIYIWKEKRYLLKKTILKDIKKATSTDTNIG